MHNLRKLEVWKKSRHFVKQIYELSCLFPKVEKFGLISQMRRCAISIPSNIAEGCERNSSKDLGRFINIAIGSSFELETQLHLAFDVNYLDNSNYNLILNRINEIQKMLIGLNRSLS